MASSGVLEWCYRLADITPPEPTGLSIRNGNGTECAHQYASQVTIFAAAGETLREDSVRLDAALRLAGVPTTLHIAPGQVHAWPTLQGLGVPEMDDSLNHLVGLVMEADAACAHCIEGVPASKRLRSS